MITFKLFLETYYPELSKETKNSFKRVSHTSFTKGKIPENKKYLHNHYANHWTPEEKKAIDNYADGDGHTLNTQFDNQKFQKQISHIRSGITKTAAPHEMHVYMGVRKDPRTVGNKINDTTTELKTNRFLSTSLNHNVAYTFQPEKHRNSNKGEKHIIKIKIPEGSRHGAYIAGVSAYPEEDEFLIKPSTLHISNTPEIGGKHNNIFIHHAKIIS